MAINNEKKPDYFTKEWYLEQKQLQKTDSIIAKELNVNPRTLYNWKQSVRVSTTKLKRKYMEKPNCFNIEWYLKQKKLGKKDVRIAEELCVSLTPFRRWKKELGISHLQLLNSEY